MDIDNLPIKIQEWLESNQLSDNLKILGEKYKISEWEIDGLRRLIILLILGQITLPEFYQDIQDDIQIENHQVLIQDINDQIFSLVKEELQKLLLFYQEDKKKAGQAAVFSESRQSLPSGLPGTPASFTFPATLTPTETLQPSFQEKQPVSLPKTVHYSDLRTPIKPSFAEESSLPTIKSPTPTTPPASLPNELIPSLPNKEPNPLNVVDLKDIPK